MTSRYLARFAVVVLALGATACGQAATPSPAPPTPHASHSAEPTPSPEPSEAATLPSTTEPADAPPPGAIVIQVGPGVVFTPDEITAPAAGTITFFLDTSQVGAIHHNFKIGLDLPPELPLAESENFDAGQSVAFTVTGLEPGTYRIWCSVNEHYNLGMTGTLVVEG